MMSRGGEERDDLTTAYEISKEDHTFEKWIEPRESALKVRPILDDGEMMGFEVSGKDEKEPF